MPHYAKCDVISRQNKKFKLKYLINKTLQRKSTKTCITVLNTLSHHAIKIFVSWALNESFALIKVREKKNCGT